MIKSITVTNYLGDSIKMELARPEKSGFAITSVTGIGPGKADINMTELATNDGANFNSARLRSRNIMLSIKYLWTDSIEEARHRSYKYFPIKKKVKLLFETDTRSAEIEGYVESNDPSIFSKAGGTDISIVCPDPFFYSAGLDGIKSTIFSGIEAAFEFPFANESLLVPMLEFSVMQVTTFKSVIYDGDADVGVTISIHANGPASGIRIYNTGTREQMGIDDNRIKALTGTGLSSGDEIVICTVKGKKSVTLIRDGARINILNCISRNADWFQISKGDNVFAYTAETGADLLQFTITNQVVYEGV